MLFLTKWKLELELKLELSGEEDTFLKSVITKTYL